MLDRVGRIEQRPGPERMEAGERLPEKDADSPDVRGRSGTLSSEPLRRDVGERSRNVADSGQCLLFAHEGKAEVEELHRHAAAVAQEHVRRLDVPVDDSV